MDKLNKEALLDEVWKITLEASGEISLKKWLKENKEALLDEVWKITLEASGGMEIPSEIQTKLELLDPMLDNALGLNKEGVRRSINYGLSKSQ